MIDLDDVLAGIFGEAVFGRLSNSRRAQLIARLLVGLLGGFLGAAGFYKFVVDPPATGNEAMKASMMGMFAFMACFFALNVGLGRKWRWPGVLFVASFVSLFVTRILFGP